MKTIQEFLRFLDNRSGATSIEYVLIAGVICIAIVAGATAIGDATRTSFESVSEQGWGTGGGAEEES
jgi:pilus assembly protein Flp/PilA